MTNERDIEIIYAGAAVPATSEDMRNIAAGLTREASAIEGIGHLKNKYWSLCILRDAVRDTFLGDKATVEIDYYQVRMTADALVSQAFYIRKFAHFADYGLADIEENRVNRCRALSRSIKALIQPS